MVIFSEITEKVCYREVIHAKAKIRCVQDCAAISARTELLYRFAKSVPQYATWHNKHYNALVFQCTRRLTMLSERKTTGRNITLGRLFRLLFYNLHGTKPKYVLNYALTYANAATTRRPTASKQ